MNKIIKYLIEIGFAQSVLLVVRMIFYKVTYKSDEDRRGYFLVKRKSMWLLFSPVFIPVLILWYVLKSIIDYINHVYGFNCHWINSEERKLSISEKISYLQKLIR
jgi:predicted membrane protein